MKNLEFMGCFGRQNLSYGQINNFHNIHCDVSVVQSIVSLTKFLVTDLLSNLVHINSSLLIFFADKIRGTFAQQKLPHIFHKKWQCFGVQCV